jgi:hypothetical protein
MQRFQTMLEPILDTVDEGLRIYRRGFFSFVLLTALGVVPLIIGAGLALATGEIWIVVLLLVLAFPLAIYVIAALSRASLAVQQHDGVRLASVLAISPLRLTGMGCYSLVFAFVVNTVTSVLSYICVCPALMFAFAFAGGVGSLLGESSSAGTVAGVALILLLFFGISLLYLFSLIISGATYSSLVYALQPFVQYDKITFSHAISLSLDLISYRFLFNVSTFLITSTIFGATALSVTTTIGALLPLPLLLLLGEESLVAQSISVCAWIIGFIVVLPPMPIWMALHYQRNKAAREGNDLAARIASITREEAPYET